LRNAASSEANNRLQSSLFIHAQRYETLAAEREDFASCTADCDSQIENSKAMLVGPLKVLNTISTPRNHYTPIADSNLHDIIQLYLRLIILQ
jgi:hypothetical protein